MWRDAAAVHGGLLPEVTPPCLGRTVVPSIVGTATVVAPRLRQASVPATAKTHSLPLVESSQGHGRGPLSNYADVLARVPAHMKKSRAGRLSVLRVLNGSELHDGAPFPVRNAKRLSALACALESAYARRSEALTGLRRAWYVELLDGRGRFRGNGESRATTSSITRRSGDAGDGFDRFGGLGPEAQPLRGWHWDSIQSAPDAAEPGYTIVVRGVHRQSVAITTDAYCAPRPPSRA
jgi:hypothetical protein